MERDKYLCVAAQREPDTEDPGGDDLFPHIYGPLPVEAVTLARFWLRGDRGWSLDDL